MVKVNKLHLMLEPMNDWCSGYRRWAKNLEWNKEEKVVEVNNLNAMYRHDWVLPGFGVDKL